MENNITKTVESLREYTKTFTDKLDKVNIPVKYDLQAEHQPSYVLHGFEYKTYADQYFLFLSKNVPYIYGSDNSHKWEKPYVDLVNNSIIKPMMIFIDGEFIHWSLISVIRDCNYTYFKIAKSYNETSSIDAILLPDNFLYRENIGKNDITNESYFIFDKNGRLDFSGENPYSTINIYGNYAESFTIPNKGKHKCTLGENFIINDDCIFLFNNKLYNPRGNVKNLGMNIITASNDAKINSDIFIFSNKNINREKDNLLTIPNRKVISEKIEDDAVNDNIRNILKEFDFNFTRNNDYETNMINTLKYIMSYNPNLLSPSYKDLSNIFSKYYTGQELKSKASVDGTLTITKNINKSLNNQLIIFKNGLLYEDYHKMYVDKKDYKIYLNSDVKDTDLFEFMYIINTVNKEYPLYLYSNTRITNEVVFDSSFLLKGSKIFSKDSKDKKFPIKTSDNIQYEVPFKYINTEHNKVKFELEDSWYYDKELTIVAGRDFRYAHLEYDATGTMFRLPSSFRFANDKKRYMVFVNNRKVDLENIKFTFTNPDVPFTGTSVYFNFVLKKNDTVDVFYLPDSMDEVVVQPKILNNTIQLNRDAIKYGLDKDIYMIFLNGKKLRPSQIDIVSSHILKVKNVDTNVNLTIIKHIPDIDILSSMFSDSDILSEFVNNLSNSDYISMYNNTAINPTDIGLDRPTISNKLVLFQIIRDFYDRPYINTGDLFSYNYEPDDGFVKDKEGNIIFDLSSIK